MSALRKSLKRPHTYLAVLLGLVVFGVADSYRSPENQLIARAYVGTVHLYQAVGRPLLEGHVQCRYKPTCSDYSIGAVEKYGIRRGLVMTEQRVRSCQLEVPLGTYDPVP